MSDTSKPDARDSATIDREQRAVSRELLRDVEQSVKFLMPNERLLLAQSILVGLLENNEIGYEHFQSAQITKKYVRQARNALRGLSIA